MSTVDMPKGVTVVAVLTLLGAIGYFFTSAVLTGLGASGHPGVYIDPASMFHFYTLTIPPLVLSFLSFVVVVGIFMGLKFSWYLSFLVWVSSIVYLIYAALSLSLNQIFIATIVLVNIIFIEYFQSVQVKRYFKIEHPANINSKSNDN
jgi:hypothetical protein